MDQTHIADDPFVQWARRRGLAYYYVRETGLPEPCLKLFLGVITAYIHRGKLQRVVVGCDGQLLDEMFCEFSQLFAMCGDHNAYLPQAGAEVLRR